jgi:hypothetical protein
MPYKNYCATWAFVVFYVYMHPRNSEIPGPVMRAYGNKDKEQPSQCRLMLDSQNQPQSKASSNVEHRKSTRPRQLSLLDK